MKTFISIALTAIFILTDLLAGNLALFPTLTVYCAAVLLIAYGWKYGLAAALAGGVIIDLIYGHTMAFYGVIFALAPAAAGSIILRGNRQMVSIFAGGCIAGLTVSAATAFFCRISGSSVPGPDVPSYIIFSTGIGGIILILMVVLFDFFAVRANLPRCIKNSYSESAAGKNLAIRHKMKNSSRRRR